MGFFVLVDFDIGVWVGDRVSVGCGAVSWFAIRESVFSEVAIMGVNTVVIPIPVDSFEF